MVPSCITAATVSTGAAVPFVVATRYPDSHAVSISTLARTSPRPIGYHTPLVSISQLTLLGLDDATAAPDVGDEGELQLPPIGVFGSFGSLALGFLPGTARHISAVQAQDLRGDEAVDITKDVVIDAKEDTVTLSGALIASVGTAARTAGDLSEPGLVVVVRLKTDEDTASPALAATAVAAAAAPNGSTSRMQLLFYDCAPSAQAGWASLCFQHQEDLVYAGAPAARQAGFLVNCSASRGNNPGGGWIECAGRQLAAVHRQYRLPGLLNLFDFFTKNEGCYHWNCTRTALAPTWKADLGSALDTLRPCFRNGSITGISLGDEMAAGGVPVSNLSAVASFIKERLQEIDGLFVSLNEATTAFGGTLHGEQMHFAGSFADFGSVPAAIDIISIDLYTGTSCTNTVPAARCGYAINGVDCLLRECEAEVVMPVSLPRIAAAASSSTASSCWSTISHAFTHSVTVVLREGLSAAESTAAACLGCAGFIWRRPPGQRNWRWQCHIPGKHHAA